MYINFELHHLYVAAAVAEKEGESWSSFGTGLAWSLSHHFIYRYYGRVDYVVDIVVYLLL